MLTLKIQRERPIDASCAVQANLARVAINAERGVNRHANKRKHQPVARVRIRCIHGETDNGAGVGILRNAAASVSQNGRLVHILNADDSIELRGQLRRHAVVLGHRSKLDFEHMVGEGDLPHGVRKYCLL